MAHEDIEHSDGSGTGRFVGQFDWEETRASTAVVEAVAEASDRDVGEMGVLYDYVDPDALDALFTDGPVADGLEVAFRYDASRVVLRGDGSVFVGPVE